MYARLLSSGEWHGACQSEPCTRNYGQLGRMRSRSVQKGFTIGWTNKKKRAEQVIEVNQSEPAPVPEIE